MRFVMLPGCNTAGPHFRGLPATRITIEGSTFDVRVREDLAEALRVNSEYAPRFGPIRRRAGLAMAHVSGCKVKEVRGDQALTTGLLDCRKRMQRRARGFQNMTCEIRAGAVSYRVVGQAIEMACIPD